MHFTRNKISSIVTIIFTIVICLFFYKRYRIAPDVATAAISFIDKNGKKYELASFNNQNKIVVFGANWCRDCIEELPALIKLQQDLTAYNITYIMLSDEQMNKIEILQSKTNFQVFQLNKPFKEYGIYSIPTFYLLSTDGNILYSHVGNINKNYNKHLQKIKSHLN